MKAFSANRTSLARQYGLNIKTFIKICDQFPEIKFDKKRRTLTPREVRTIYDCLGEPEEFQKP